jgi:hypothetical protein
MEGEIETETQIRLFGKEGAEEKAVHPAEQVRAWWLATAEADFNLIAPRIAEYASYDLDVLGRITLEMLNLPSEDRALRTEVACLWFAQAKIARALSAYKEGRTPSEDSLLDCNAYLMMARRAREAGSWPGV